MTAKLAMPLDKFGLHFTAYSTTIGITEEEAEVLISGQAPQELSDRAQHQMRLAARYLGCAEPQGRGPH